MEHQKKTTEVMNHSLTSSQSNSKRRFFLTKPAVFAGNVFENYSAALFGLLSPFLAPFMFPKESAQTALLFTYALFFLSSLAKPLGALYFGYRSDAYGRKQTLLATFFGAAIVTFLIAWTPTYQQAGIMAPFLFFLGKALQQFFSAGKKLGGAIFYLEETKEHKHDFASACFASSSIFGHLLASLLIAILAMQGSIETSWRLLYVLGSLYFFFFLPNVGFSDESSPLKKTLTKRDLLKSLFTHRKEVFVIALCTGFSYATYSLGLVFMNGFIPLITSFSKADLILINTFLLALDCISLPFFGKIAEKIKRENLMLLSCLLTICLAIPLLTSLRFVSLSGIVFIRVTIVFLGISFFAPFHAFVQKLVPEKERSSLISLGYVLGSQFFGSTTPFIALYFFKSTNSLEFVAYYWMFLAFLTAFAIYSVKQTRD